MDFVIIGMTTFCTKIVTVSLQYVFIDFFVLRNEKIISGLQMVYDFFRQRGQESQIAFFSTLESASLDAARGYIKYPV